MRPAVFAIPGDITQKTGGYIYEHQLLLSLRAAGRRVDHLWLPGTFPNPTPAEMAASVAALMAIPADTPLILDGLVYGAIETDGLAQVRAPIVGMIHHPLGLETGLPPARAQELLAREAANLALAAHVVVPSPHTKRILVADFGVPADRISIALPGFARPDPVRTPTTPPLILSIGLLAARKGHDTLLSALARITDLDWQAQIVGGTHDAAVAAALHSQCRALGLEDRVRFAGLLDDATLRDRYRSASVFALATRYEGYGMVFSEAMLFGLPIVTCATGAVPETVPPEAGLLVPVDDAEAFGQAIRRLLTDQALRDGMAQASARLGQSLPSWQDTAAIMGQVLDTVPLG